MMDKLEFHRKVIKNENFGRYIHAEIIINGVPFAIIAEEHERLAAEKGTGDYKGFDYEYEVAHGLYNDLTQDNYRTENPTQKALMMCSGCHEAGCWGLYVTVKEEDGDIVWRNIRNYHMAKRKPGKTKWWDYSEFLAFRFDKLEYSAALEVLKMIADESRIKMKDRWSNWE